MCHPKAKPKKDTTTAEILDIIGVPLDFRASDTDDEDIPGGNLEALFSFDSANEMVAASNSSELETAFAPLSLLEPEQSKCTAVAEMHFSTGAIKKTCTETMIQYDKIEEYIISDEKLMAHYDRFGFPAFIKNSLRRHNYFSPTDIQENVWPAANSGENLIGIAKPQTGKTLAYLLPAMLHVQTRRAQNAKTGPFALVLTMTNRNAFKIHDMFKSFSFQGDMTSACLVAGVPDIEQNLTLQKGVHIAIGTIDRIKELLTEKSHRIWKRVSYVVLDKVDQMLEMKRMPEVYEILAKLPPEHQTLLFSTTWNEDVELLAEQLLGEYTAIDVRDPTYRNKHMVDVCEDNEKLEKLKYLLEIIMKAKGSTQKVVIFVRDPVRADEAQSLVISLGIECSILGNSENAATVSKQSSSGEVNVVVVIDESVANLAVKRVDHVIHLDFPKTVNDYLFRNKRCDLKGISHIFFSKENIQCARELVVILKRESQPLHPDLVSMVYQQISQSKESGIPGNRLEDNGNPKNAVPPINEADNALPGANKNYVDDWHAFNASAAKFRGVPNHHKHTPRNNVSDENFEDALSDEDDDKRFTGYQRGAPNHNKYIPRHRGGFNALKVDRGSYRRYSQGVSAPQQDLKGGIYKKYIPSKPGGFRDGAQFHSRGNALNQRGYYRGRGNSYGSTLGGGGNSSGSTFGGRGTSSSSTIGGRGSSTGSTLGGRGSSSSSTFGGSCTGPLKPGWGDQIQFNKGDDIQNQSKPCWVKLTLDNYQGFDKGFGNTVSGASSSEHSRAQVDKHNKFKNIVGATCPFERNRPGELDNANDNHADVFD